MAAGLNKVFKDIDKKLAKEKANKKSLDKKRVMQKIAYYAKLKNKSK